VGAVELAWVERDMRDEGEQTPVVRVARMIQEFSRNYDFILIDCPPSISFFTECWLRHADLHLTPSKPELLSNVGLRLVREIRTKAMKAGRKLATDMGVLITIARGTESDRKWIQRMREDRYLTCFDTVIPQTDRLQRIADMNPEDRKVFSKKYGDASASATAMTREFLTRHEQYRAGRTIGPTTVAGSG
jgi:chromosome partitioning protein